MASQNYISFIIVLLVTLCALMPRTAQGFWVAPMWGNKLDSVEYGRQSNTLPEQAPDAVSYGSDMYGESNTGFMKYPGWVSRKQGKH
jgi:hypothetical protein